MAFKIGNKIVLHDADPSATLLTESNLDRLQINGVDVLTHDGTTVTLKNVDINDALESTINTDNLTEGTTNLFFTDARAVSALSGLATTVSNNTTAINNNATAISNNATAIANNATAITNNATAITNNETAINNNVTAIANTLVDAKAYTDTRETAITTAYTAAIASSTSSGSTAANAYTDAEIATATASITSAYQTADATTLSSAQTYADTAEADAVTTANAYTDAREVAITTAYQTYTDTAEADAKAYADTQIANLVDSAPTTLDTLNELASALGDDANFSTTVTNSIATKLPLAGGTMAGDLTLSGAPTNNLHAATKAYVDSAVTGGTGALDTDDIAEGTTNLYYTDARADARATLRINAATTDNIDEGSTNLYYTNTRARTEIEGADLDLGTNKILYSNVYATTGDLPSATSYHGMFAHVHGTGKGYFAHANNWVELANQSDIPTNNNQLTNGAGYVTTDTNTTYTAGNGLSLVGTEFLMSGSYTGDFTATGDVTAYSDKRLKRNIETINNAVDTVSKLRGVNFEKDGRHSTGVIAQEVEEVLPQVVHTAPDGMKSVAYGNIVGLLIEAIKEQQKEIEELKKKI